MGIIADGKKEWRFSADIRIGLLQVHGIKQLTDVRYRVS